MDIVVILLIAVVILYGMGRMARPQVNFQIRYRGGIPRVVRGRITDAMLKSIDEICQQNSVKHGTITAFPGKRVRITFTSDIPTGCQQQIRNMMLFN